MYRGTAGDGDEGWIRACGGRQRDSADWGLAQLRTEE
jgi:hypothetical protein